MPVRVSRYIDAGHMDKFVDSRIEQTEKHLRGRSSPSCINNPYCQARRG